MSYVAYLSVTHVIRQCPHFPKHSSRKPTDPASQDQLFAKWPMMIADRISILGKSTISGLSKICYYSKCVSSWMGHGASISVELFGHIFDLPSVWPRRRVDNSRTLFAPFRRGVLRLGMSRWEIWHRHLASDLVQTKVQTTSAHHIRSFLLLSREIFT